MDLINLAQNGDKLQAYGDNSVETGFHKKLGILDNLRNYQLIKKNSAPWI